MVRSKSRVSYVGFDGEDDTCSEYEEPVETVELDDDDEDKEEEPDNDADCEPDNDADFEPDDDALREVDEQLRLFDPQQNPDVSPEDFDMDDEEPVLFNGNIKPASYYRNVNKTLKESDYMRKKYAPGTLRFLLYCDRQWNLFCRDILCVSDPARSWKRVNFRNVYTFLDWFLGQRTGEDGRAKKGLRKRQSFLTFWCNFRLAYERATNGKNINDVVSNKLIRNALVKLPEIHGLSSDRRDNRSMTLEDLKYQIQTTLQTTEMAFKLGEQRILAVLFLLLLAPAGSRPASVLALRFGDLEVSLVRDPEGGPHRLIISVTMIFTKRYRGEKDAHTFLIPEIIYDPSLFLSPHVFLLAILFHNRAFFVEPLNDRPEMLGEMDIHAGDQQLLLEIKEELRHVPIFRKTEDTFTGPMTSDKAITGSMMRNWVHSVGKLAGFETNTICYSLRYMTGNNLDQNVNISEDMRNLILDHKAQSATFQRHYLNRNFSTDIHAIFRATQPQQELVKQAVSHGRNRSSRRPAKLTPTQSAAAVKGSTQVQRLAKELKNIPMQHPAYGKASLKLKAAKRKAIRDAEAKMRREWTSKQAAEDIERQLQGKGFDTSHTGGRVVQPMSPAQTRMVEALHAPLVNNFQAQLQRRAAAVRALAAYCSVEEPLITPVMQARQQGLPDELRLPSREEQVRVMRNSVIVTKPGQRLVRCFICVGKALTLAPDDLNIRKYCHSYGTPYEITRHFTRTHLTPLLKTPNKAVKCNVCPGVILKNLMHFQNHCELVHGIKTAALTEDIGM